MRRGGIFLLLALAAFSSGAEANLGESKAQIEGRWGAPVKITGYPDERNYTYEFDQFEVQVGYIDGISQSELYRHRDKKISLSKNEVERLFRDNSLGKEWQANGERHELSDKSAWAYTDGDSSNIRRVNFETAKSFDQWQQRTPKKRTGKEISFVGPVRLRQVDKTQWLVVHSGSDVLEIPWSTEGFPAPTSEVKGDKIYTFNLLDEENLDMKARVACRSDREHKDWSDAVYDSKTYLLARVQDGRKVLFDRSICELHHVKMISVVGDIGYGLVAYNKEDEMFPHARDSIRGGCVVGSKETAPVFLCPKCVDGWMLQQWVKRDKRIGWLEWMLDAPAPRLRWR